METRYCRNLLNQGRAIIKARGRISTKHLMELEQNMAYKVIIMLPAKRRLDMYVSYTLEKLKNRQVARAILEDTKATKRRLMIT